MAHTRPGDQGGRVTCPLYLPSPHGGSARWAAASLPRTLPVTRRLPSEALHLVPPWCSSHAPYLLTTPLLNLCAPFHAA